MSHRDICIVYWRVFSKFLLLPLLAAILNFFIKCKSAFILEIERARVISTKFLIHNADSIGDFCKNCFPTIFGGHLEFLHKTCLSWKQNEIKRFQRNFLSYLLNLAANFRQNHFSATFGVHLELLLYNTKACLSQKWNELMQF